MGRTHLLLAVILAYIIRIRATCDLGQEPQVSRQPSWKGTVVVNVTCTENEALFFWDVTPEIPRLMKIFVRETQNMLACETPLICGEWNSRSRKTKKEPIYISPYSFTKLEVRVNNVTGFNNCTSGSKLPETRVTGLECFNELCVASVDNNCDTYNGANFHIKFFLEIWNETLQDYSSVKTIDKNTTENSTATVFLKELNVLPLTSYRLTAFPANEVGKNSRGDLIKKTTFTTPKGKAAPTPTGKATAAPIPTGKAAPTPTGKATAAPTPTGKAAPTPTGKGTVAPTPTGKAAPTPTGKAAPITTGKVPLNIKNLMSSKNDRTTINLSWMPPLPHQNLHYLVSLFHDDIMLKNITINMTTTSFEKLHAGTKYVAKVQACIVREQCGDEEEIAVWTWPDQPVIDNTKPPLNETTSTTITIYLPAFHNLPGSHWVTMKRYEKNQDKEENIKEKAKETVNQTMKNEQNQTSQPNDKEFTDYTELRVMRRVKQEKGNIQEKVEVGKHSPLNSNTEYVVVIVAEKSAGGHSQLHSCEPRIYKTKHAVDPNSAITMIVSLCTAAVLLGLAVVKTFIWCQKRRQDMHQPTLRARSTRCTTNVHHPPNQGIAVPTSLGGSSHSAGSNIYDSFYVYYDLKYPDNQDKSSHQPVFLNEYDTFTVPDEQSVVSNQPDLDYCNIAHI